MLRVVDYRGKTHLVSLSAIARCSELGASDKYMGRHSVVVLHDGTRIETSSTVNELNKAIDAETSKQEK